MVNDLWEDWLWDVPIGSIGLGKRRLMLPDGFSAADSRWISPLDLSALADGEVSIDSRGNRLLRKDPDDRRVYSERSAEHSFLIQHPWDVLRAMEDALGRLSESRIEGEVHPLAVVDGLLELGRGSRVLPGVVIEGHVVIGEDCKIGPNAYLRGCTSIGNNCHVGNAVEIKNSILMSHTCVGHLSYVGDSVVGRNVNLGAGTITANFRHDGSNGKATVAGRRVDTGRGKLGAIVGDRVHTGINTSIYPGRCIGAGCTTLPGQVVDRDLESGVKSAYGR